MRWHGQVPQNREPGLLRDIVPPPAEDLHNLAASSLRQAWRVARRPGIGECARARPHWCRYVCSALLPQLGRPRAELRRCPYCFGPCSLCLLGTFRGGSGDPESRISVPLWDLASLCLLGTFCHHPSAMRRATGAALSPLMDVSESGLISNRLLALTRVGAPASLLAVGLACRILRLPTHPPGLS